MKTFGLIFLIVVLIILGGFVLLSKNTTPVPVTRTSISPSVTERENPSPTINNSNLRAGGSSYRDTQGVYVFLYPADYILDTQDKQHVRIYKTGATQKGQTEMYDGVIMVFETIVLNKQTLNTWVDTTLKTATEDGTSQIIDPKKAISLHSYQGFTYSMRGLGISKEYVFQKDTNSPYAVHISTSVNDPQNVGFQTDVDTILSTFEILK